MIYFCFPYYGDKGLQLLKSWIRKIKVNCKNDQPVVFKILYDVCKMEFFCNTKDRTPIINQSFVVYQFMCMAVVQIMWEKLKEHYMNDVLNTHGVIKKVLWKITSNSVLKYTYLKCSTYLILPVWVQHCFQIIAILGMLTIEIHVSIYLLIIPI